MDKSEKLNDLYLKRRNKLRALLKTKGLDAMLVVDAANRFYLSGFELHDPQPNESAGCLLIAANGEDWVATDSRYTLAAQRLWDKEHIFIYGADAFKQVALLSGRVGSLIGVEGKGLSLKSWRQLTARQAGQFVPCFLTVDDLVEKLRLIKDESEIAALKKSFQLNHAMLAWLENRIKENLPKNMSEQSLAWDIEKYFRDNGAQELAFSSIVALGPNAALPHAIPENKAITQNEPLLIDVGCRVENYCSDQTRTFWLGQQPTREFEKTMKLVRKAQSEALAMMKPGIACADVYLAAKNVFEEAGEAKAFTHSLGHGVGLETHEGPSLSPRSKAILQKNMVVTVEPGLYYPQWGGIRWENTVLVTDDGVQIL